MASAAVWLDELGIPPREVCLDWAWQIQMQFANMAHSADEETTELRWQRIEVNDTGELVLPRDLKKYSADERLQELLNWARSGATSLSSSGGSTTGRSEVECTLRQLTDNCVAGFAVAIKPVPDLQIETSQFTSSEGLFDPKLARPRTRVASLNWNLANQMSVALKRHWLVASVASVILIAGCFLALNAGTGNVKSSALSQSTREAASGTSPDRAIRGGNTAIGSAPELDDSEILATLAEMPQFGVIEPEAPVISQSTMPIVSSAALAGLGSKQLGSNGLESNGLGSSDSDGSGISEGLADATGNKSSEPRLSGERETAIASELTQRDVMQELETLTKSAASNAVETDMAVLDSEDASTVSEPLVLRTSPMIQTQKLAAKIKVRPRQPIWQILLSADVEFELAPKEFQNISDRQVTTWLLSDSDSNSPKVRLVIQAQAAPGRQTALRWRIFAGAEDLPDLILPLDKEILQPLQERLRVYVPMVQRESERLKQLANVAEREVRSALFKQRANLESQSKLASRLSTIVAEARLLDDLLRNQLTVYAKLRDGADSNAPTLLQFGDLRELEAKNEESKPHVTED